MVDAHLKVTNLVFSMFYFRFHFIQSEGSSPAGADLQGALHLRTLIIIDIEQSLCWIREDKLHCNINAKC